MIELDDIKREIAQRSQVVLANDDPILLLVPIQNGLLRAFEQMAEKREQASNAELQRRLTAVELAGKAMMEKAIQASAASTAATIKSAADEAATSCTESLDRASQQALVRIEQVVATRVQPLLYTAIGLCGCSLLAVVAALIILG